MDTNDACGFDVPKDSTLWDEAVLTPTDETLVERLVDDDLNADERRELIYRLDETVDGWRFCALTFMEAQAFRSALRQQSLPNASPRPCARLRRRLFDAPRRSLATSAALGFIAAVAIFACYAKFGAPRSESDAGTLVAESPNIGVFKEPSTSDSAQTIASVVADDASRASDSSAGYGSAMGGGMGGFGRFDMEPETSEPKFAARTSKESSMQASAETNVKDESTPTSSKMIASNRRAKIAPLDVDRSSNSFSEKTVAFSIPELGLINVDTPCVESDRFDEQMVAASNAALPAAVEQELRNAGGRVESKHNVYRFPLEGGKTLIVPVDVYENKYDRDFSVW